MTNGHPHVTDFEIAPGDRMLIRCEGGPSMCRVEHFPPRLEIEERGGLYVLADDGPAWEWSYHWVPDLP